MYASSGSSPAIAAAAAAAASPAASTRYRGPADLDSDEDLGSPLQAYYGSSASYPLDGKVAAGLATGAAVRPAGESISPHMTSTQSTSIWHAGGGAAAAAGAGAMSAGPNTTRASLNSVEVMGKATPRGWFSPMSAAMHAKQQMSGSQAAAGVSPASPPS